MKSCSAKRAMARGRKAEETSVNTYLVRSGGSTRSSSAVIPPVPPPTSRMRSGWSAGHAATAARSSSRAVALWKRQSGVSL